MPNIRPVSDLRNYAEVLKEIKSYISIERFTGEEIILKSFLMT